MPTKKTKKTVADTKEASVSVLKLDEAQKTIKDNLQLQLNTTTLIRSSLLNKLINPGKDINFECGYPDQINSTDYKALYLRNGIAKRVVQLLPDETWAIQPDIYETEDTNETEFEKIWTSLVVEKRVLHYLNRIDVLSGIGEFGILLLGINDGKDIDKPVEGINELTGEFTKGNSYELLYLKAFDQTAVSVKTKETNFSSPRYGYPKLYNVNFEAADNPAATVSKVVHWTRILHVADGRESSEIYGTPRMRPIYNRILDIRKILGGSGEMFWKGGYPGLSFETNPEPGDTALDTESIKDQVENYMSGMQRYLATEGLVVKSLQPNIADPKEHVEVNLRNIAISLGVPYRIFMGSEEAKLASSQDARTWNKRISARQEGYATPYILRPFIERLIAFGVLPQPESYIIDWPDLNAPTDEDKATIANLLTESLTKYVAGGVDALIPPIQYLTIILGLSQEEAETIEKAANNFLDLEEQKKLMQPEPKKIKSDFNTDNPGTGTKY
jgi:uncharacterized protein